MSNVSMNLYIADARVAEIKLDYADNFHSNGSINYLPEFEKYRSVFEEYAEKRDLIDALEENENVKGIEVEYELLDELDRKIVELGLFVKDSMGKSIEIDPVCLDLSSSRISYRG